VFLTVTVHWKWPFAGWRRSPAIAEKRVRNPTSDLKSQTEYPTQLGTGHRRRHHRRLDRKPASAGTRGVSERFPKSVSGIVRPEQSLKSPEVTPRAGSTPASGTKEEPKGSRMPSVGILEPLFFPAYPCFATAYRQVNRQNAGDFYWNPLRFANTPEGGMLRLESVDYDPITVGELVAEYLDDCKIRNLSQQTTRWYGFRLKTLIGSF